MQEVQDNYDVGVIIGRFQVPDLHTGHIALINHVTDRHKKVIVVLGISQTFNTVNEPLDWESRKDMINELYPSVIVLGVKDEGSDTLWSASLDRAVAQVVSPTQSVVLYGSRDSFITAYCGGYATKELVQEHYQSGTEVRDTARQHTSPTSEFRHGVVWAAANRFPTVFTCVDVAIFNNEFTKMLLGKKKMDTGLRLVGGFADVNSPSFEDDAYREVFEETRCGLTSLDYLSSFTIDDWRYRKEPDIIKTLLFRATTEDVGKAGDDLDSIVWMDTMEVLNNIDKLIEPLHRPLVNRAIIRRA